MREIGLGGGDARDGIGVVHPDQELAGLHLLVEIDVDLLDDAGSGA